MIFDTHAHYDDKAFNDDRDTLLPKLNSEGIAYIIDPGCDLKSSEAAVSLAEKYSFIYAAVGIHPEELNDFSENSYEKLQALANHPKCVAIGEIGLDYYWDATRKDEQKRLFTCQLELALELDKPVIVHDREAHADSLEAVRRYKGIRGVFHCYSGSAEMAQELLKMGWYLGFDGPITYKNARKAVEVLEICPPDRLVIETDSPYLSPVPMRGRRNDSRNLAYVIDKIAEIKGLPAEKICDITMKNAKELFKI